MDSNSRAIITNLFYSTVPRSPKAKFILSRLSAMTGRTQQSLIVRLVIDGFILTKDEEISKLRSKIIEEIKSNPDISND